MGSSAQFTSETIARLEALGREELVCRWNKAFGHPPFKGARRSTLARGLAYHLQCKAYGGLKPSISRQLLKIGSGGSVEPAKEFKKPIVQVGSQLVREWNGKTHTVIVTDKGYALNGITYTSLTAAAKAITGAHWSGPRFFGVAP